MIQWKNWATLWQGDNVSDRGTQILDTVLARLCSGWGMTSVNHGETLNRPKMRHPASKHVKILNTTDIIHNSFT